MTITVSLPGNRVVHKVVTRRRHGIKYNSPVMSRPMAFSAHFFLINRKSIYL